MILITQRRAPHVSMEAMQSTSRPAADETFPDTHLTSCDLHCSGATAAWRAIHVTWSDPRPGYVVRFRNLMPSLRARRTGGWGYTLQYCSQDNSRASTDRVVNALSDHDPPWGIWYRTAMTSPTTEEHLPVLPSSPRKERKERKEVYLYSAFIVATTLKEIMMPLPR